MIDFQLTDKLYLSELFSPEIEKMNFSIVCPSLIKTFQKTRDIAAKKYGLKGWQAQIFILSGFRSWGYHVALYKRLNISPIVKNSKHLVQKNTGYFHAIDIRHAYLSQTMLYDIAKDIPEWTGIGFGKGKLHLDTYPRPKANREWSY